MSNQGKYYDNTPFIPMAGSTTGLSGIGTDHSIRQDLYFKSKTSTPAFMVKYRKTKREIPGVKQIHYGLYDDPRDYEDYIHGVKTEGSDHVPDCIKGNNLSGNRYFLDQLHEQKYSTGRRYPLGHSIMRSYKFPDEVKNSDFRFGIPTKGFFNAKDVIYNGCLLTESPDVKKLYQRTHGLSDPGEQKNRDYKWGFDKHDHVYGLPQEKEINGCKKSLESDYLYGPYPPTKIVDKRLENYRQATSTMLGKGKCKGTLNKNLGDDHTFGLKYPLSDCNASKCIYGDPLLMKNESLDPDPDLGRSVRFRSKFHMPSEFDNNKTFGIPSIRRDLPQKTLVSVSDLRNYGNEKDVYELLYPHPCATRGIDDEDFDHFYSKEEIDKLLKEHDYGFPEDEFDIIYMVCLKNYPNEEGKITPNSFLATMRNLKKEYRKYRTIDQYY